MPIDASSGFAMISLLNIISSNLVNSSAVAGSTGAAGIALIQSNLTNSSGVLNAASAAIVNTQISNLITWANTFGVYGTSAVPIQSTMNMVGGYISSLLGLGAGGTKISG